MKKIIALLLGVLTLFCFASCGNASKLNDMQEFGKEATVLEAATWVNNVIRREHPQKDDWYNVKMNAEIKEEYDDTVAEIEYLIKVTYQPVDDFKKLVCKMSVDFELHVSQEINGEKQISITEVEMDIICVDGLMYADVKTELTEGAGEEKSTTIESAKIKAKIEKDGILSEIDEAFNIFSLEFLQDIVQEGFSYYLSDNYFGARIDEDGQEVAVYYEFEEGTSIIAEAGLKESFKMSEEIDMQTQMYLKKCEPIRVEAPKDADAYENAEIPDINMG